MVVDGIAIIAALKYVLLLAEHLTSQSPVAIKFIAGGGDFEDEIARPVFWEGFEDHRFVRGCQETMMQAACQEDTQEPRACMLSALGAGTGVLA